MARASVLAVLVSVSMLLLSITFKVSVFASVSSSAYVDSSNQFSISPPSGWAVDSSGVYRTSVIFYGPVDSSFRINMNIIVQATSLNLSDYVSAAKYQLAASFTTTNNYTLVSQGSTTVGGVAGYQLVNEWTQGSYNIKDEQDIVVQNQKAYIITSTALQSNYPNYQPTFDESVQTFKLAGPAFPWSIVIVSAVLGGMVVVGLTLFLVRRRGRVNMPPEIPQSLPSTSPP